MLRAGPRPVAVLCAGSAVLLIGMGLRQAFAMFLHPVTTELHWSRESFSLGIAVQLLVWGFSQPVAGAIADRYGTGRVVFGGGLLYAAGVGLSALAWSPVHFGLTVGCMVGMGMGGAGFAVVLAGMVRAMPPERSSLVMGIGTAAASVGQFLLVPLAAGLISARGWAPALALLAVVAAAMCPLGFALRGKPAARAEPAGGGALAAARQAFAHPGFVMLTLGYFVCGFQLAFIGNHLPAYLEDLGSSAAAGAMALSLVGLCNVVGCLVFGALGDRYPKKHLLASIYLARAVAITWFVLAPPSLPGLVAFAAVMGFLWLSTVPLTTGLVTELLGSAHLAMLGGLVFCSHQVGSFLGVWLGGLIFDHTGSYTAVWWASVVLGLLSAALHLGIRRAPRTAVALA
ncbi:MFS transporter [Prauserella muralis]|uniref:Uncharacterized protein n=1 Tax=Prauserella muralis TaxID=588067 RepID=A0A2V4ANW5_9PSEU|nr:MFS transporter [Prauserella muralis]PXY22138.1 hypothetical protein BAY60_19755 [Prauserella muralis]TWE27735.1 putative MFS family arabinose efflux permease [Prauserella muralis]